ncbi:MAG: cellulose binding domain-containing protein [Catenulispora sp.]
MLRRLLMSVLATVVSLAGLLAPGAAHAATAAAPSDCTGGISVSQFAFNPATVPPGGRSDLTLVLQNCGSQTVRGSTIWYGHYTGQGCPVIDPAYPVDFTIAPGAGYTLTETYGDPGMVGCRPTALTISVSVGVTGVGPVATPTATLQFVCAGGGISVDQFSFNPGTISAGQNSTATLLLQNCTGHAVTGTTTWVPRFTWSGTGLPPGCPAMDPVGFAYSMAPGATATVTLGLGDPIASCLATGLHATVTVNEDGVTGPVATANADLVILQPAPRTCHVTYAPTDWTGGFTANVTIANTGPSAMNGWTLTFTFPGDEKISLAWNANVRQNGADVTASNLSYNGVIAPGGNQSFGFQGTWTSSYAPPTAFSVNGAPCS